MDNHRPLEGKVVLVTGASGGLGDRFSRHLAAHGAKVAVAARRTDRLEVLVRGIEASDGAAAAFALDVTERASIERCLDAVEARWGGIDVLVNNSGVTATHRLEDVSEADFDAIFAINVRGAFFVAQGVARRLLARQAAWGSIVNIASAAGLRPLPQIGPYAISKAAVVHMTKAMALEWGRKGINVNAICPGYIRTELNEQHWDSEAGRKLLARLPRRRLGSIDDLTGVLLLLCSPASHFVNGTAIAVDDGLSV